MIETSCTTPKPLLLTASSVAWPCSSCGAASIDPRIYHVKLIHDHLGNLAGRRVLDVGCGKGRFARVFQEQEPRAELWGLDISEEMLRYVPAGIHTRAGAMTELPFEDGFFDGAYATESLEHAVEIAKAVSEICRV